jgi:hypothetical protein
VTRDIPHLRIVLIACAAAIIGYAGFCIWVVAYLRDATMIGDIVGTWKSFAVAAFAFWLGSSSGGKAAAPPHGTEADPSHTIIDNPATEPVPVQNNPQGA